LGVLLGVLLGIRGLRLIIVEEREDITFVSLCKIAAGATEVSTPRWSLGPSSL